VFTRVLDRLRTLRISITASAIVTMGKRRRGRTRRRRSRAAVFSIAEAWGIERADCARTGRPDVTAALRRAF
jgi:hypothetical protein